ncbi:sigma-54 dependent transcriptional regulator [Cupriavidus respiraculi]|uniref:Anaerobic nitric oxide reductase transcription regulator NorR n=1 Tax=Cupriavidus respiraculi TaxID=195930 RepID=A0ABN7Y7U1_9BURK|nr:sigma-54 dependent transcriptional regulator [Cupriavidus respiraculi]MBY4949680.1 sigma-54 dependent transcriptional regulator [Cupriavidus respiraculi]CAG9169438.1 Anaerobic nitric oxide reductase transcription regulator NorR [Cupriavidus respiraculi]
MDRLCKAAPRAAQVVVVSRQPNYGIDAARIGGGWDVRHVQQVRELARVLRNSPPMAGVIDLESDYTDADLAHLEQSLQYLHVMWVAITTAEKLEDERIRRLIRDYCVDYVRTPYTDSELLYTLKHAHGMASLHSARAHEMANHGPMIGECAAMRAMFRSLTKVAHNDAPVFISGESGTGKELAAQAIHEASNRRKGPFVAINCGAIPSHLVQSELFGYEKGAFTGANQRKIGWIEQAQGGTLFLDEIGDLPLESQVALLRFLQQGMITRLGGHQSIPLDLRIISATHVDLIAAQAEGRFRADLFHRLCVLTLTIPPLRERGEDILLLANAVLANHGHEAHRRIRGFSPCATQAMMQYGWPGNVRELINRVRRAIVMTDNRKLTAEDLQLAGGSDTPRKTLDAIREEAEREAIRTVMASHGFHVVPAARELNVSRVTLYRLMHKHNIRVESHSSQIE